MFDDAVPPSGSETALTTQRFLDESSLAIFTKTAFLVITEVKDFLIKVSGFDALTSKVPEIYNVPLKVFVICA